jgi:hypothetical protein
MKKALVGFAIVGSILCLVMIVSVMYTDTKVGMQVQAQKVQSAAETRPRDLQLLKHPKVRAACVKNPDWEMEVCQTIDHGEVSMGMTADQVRLSWGKPQRINATLTSQNQQEQWVYGKQYLYMQNGVLKSMQTPR